METEPHRRKQPRHSRNPQTDRAGQQVAGFGSHFGRERNRERTRRAGDSSELGSRRAVRGHELFGHERGSFTGAHQRKIGKLELAGSGSLFLDEIGDLTTDAQSKLLRVLQERTFERVGGNMAIPFEARVIAASHRNLGELIKEGRFREDLFFRLKVVEIHVPPLRDRVEDIPAITDYLLEKINRELHRSITKIPESVMRRLQRNDWPGNVRELENVLTQAVLHSTGDTLTLDFLREPAESPPGELATLAEMEKQHIAKVLRAVDWNLGNACEVLGISRPTLRKKMEDYGISAPGP
ncbi:sigma 54-interacting transcriptional regulator [bacterium]|nr:sigma 54-interacting transcriptional regulator [bacterium]